MDTNLNVSFHPYILFFVSIVALQTISVYSAKLPDRPSPSSNHRIQPATVPRILKYVCICVCVFQKEIIPIENVCGKEYCEHPPSIQPACLPACLLLPSGLSKVRSKCEQPVNTLFIAAINAFDKPTHFASFQSLQDHFENHFSVLIFCRFRHTFQCV